MNTTQNSTKSKIVKVIGVDLAKDHCDVIGYDENGKMGLSVYPWVDKHRQRLNVD